MSADLWRDYRADGGLDIVHKHLNIQDNTSKGETPMSTEREYAKNPPETDEQRKARTGLSSLQISDDQAAAVQKTPNRISLADIEAAIESTQYMYPTNIHGMTICTIRLKNGYGLVGKSAVADTANFDIDLGMKFAREDAIRSAWPLFAFALREKLTRSGPPYTGEAS